MPTSVLILDKHADIYERRLQQRFPGLRLVTVPDRSACPPDLSAIDVLITFGIAIDDDLMRRLTSLRWAQSLATGVDHFVKCPYFRAETLLTSARGIHGPGMRETVAFLMLSLSRDAVRLVTDKQARRWDRGTPWTPLNGQTAAVVGIGVGGTAIAQLLAALGMRVIGLTRSPRPVEGFDEVVHTDRLVEIAARCDWLIGILPGDAANNDIFGRHVFQAMPHGARFINVGRGSTVDEDALIEALQSGHLGGAGLDVFRTSPLPVSSPLWSMPNVFICPMIGGFTSDYEDMVWPIVEENMALFLAGRATQMRNLIAH